MPYYIICCSQNCRVYMYNMCINKYDIPYTRKMNTWTFYVYIPHYSLLFCERPGGRISLFTFKMLHDLYHGRVERTAHVLCFKQIKTECPGITLRCDVLFEMNFFSRLCFYSEEPSRFRTATIRLEEVVLLLLSQCGMVMKLRVPMCFLCRLHWI